MTKNIVASFFILSSILAFSQQYKAPFQGKLVYSIHMQDTAMQKFFTDQKMTIYTNDTFVRTENFSNQLGLQVSLKHTFLNKSILMLTAKGVDYAIQTDLNKQDTTKKDEQLIYKKLIGKRKIAGLKVNRIRISNPKNKTTIEVWYSKQLSHKYVDAFPKIKGLPVKYYLSTEDGIFEYSLVSIEEAVVNRDLFGVPSNYKKVTFDQFIDEVLKNN